MSNKSMIEGKFINELVRDCITYRLTETEALEYIKTRFKPISLSSYKLRKASVISDKSTQLWLNDFTRIGFVSNHKKHIEHIEAILEDSMRQFYLEKNEENRDEYKILKLKDNVIETTKLLSELNLGTPIISSIKAKLQEKEKENGTKAVQISQ